jgi:hypothetical protein
MWDKDGKMVYESSRKDVFAASWVESAETLPEKGERIVGVKSCTDKTKHATTPSSSCWAG